MVREPRPSRFTDRVEAGRLLGQRLAAMDIADPIVLGLPRGGVPVAAQVARALGAPLDVLLVRKLGVPSREEFAFGAIGEDGARVLDDSLVRQLGLDADDVERVERRERTELERRRARYRAGRAPRALEGRTAVIVDDGLATGATARVAVEVARARGARRIIVAVPVAPRDAVADLARLVDVVCLLTPGTFQAVGEWYDAFDQTSDDEVTTLLADARGETP